MESINEVKELAVVGLQPLYNKKIKAAPIEYELIY